MRSVALPTGVRLAYAEQGNPACTPIIMLHGATDSRMSYAGVMPHLPPWLHAIAVSLRGHGMSDRPATGYRPSDLAADVAALIDTLGLGPAIVVGHSMGGSVALRMAIEHPHLVRGLVLAGARPRWRGHPEIEALCAEALALTDPVDPRFVRAFQEGTTARPVADAFMEEAIAESLRLPARTWHAVFRDAVRGAEDVADLHRISAPALLLCGERDTLAFDAQATLATGIRGAWRVTYAGTGHALHWEEPARFAADLAGFAAWVNESWPPAQLSA